MELSLCWKEASRRREVREETQRNGYCLVKCDSKGLRKPIWFYALWRGEGRCWTFWWLGDSWACNKVRWTLDFKWRSETSRSVSWQQNLENFRKATFIKSKGTPWGEDLKSESGSHTGKLGTGYLENRAWKVFGWLSDMKQWAICSSWVTTNQSRSPGAL